MTGHLVFSTLHTNDAASSITRLVDMGVEPYLVASSLESVMAQRLIRRLCTQCRCAVDRKQLEVPSGVNLVEPETIFKPVGCRACNGTGYAGRQAIFELMINTAKIRELCLQNASADVLQRAAIQDGMQTLRQSAWHLVSTGVTSLDELYRVCPSTDS
jgi:general secretion pathway protein E/type IV pilus assembly protein PilB